MKRSEAIRNSNGCVTLLTRVQPPPPCACIHIRGELLVSPDRADEWGDELTEIGKWQRTNVNCPITSSSRSLAPMLASTQLHTHPHSTHPHARTYADTHRLLCSCARANYVFTHTHTSTHVTSTHVPGHPALPLMDCLLWHHVPQRSKLPKDDTRDTLNGKVAALSTSTLFSSRGSETPLAPSARPVEKWKTNFR